MYWLAHVWETDTDINEMTYYQKKMQVWLTLAPASNRLRTSISEPEAAARWSGGVCVASWTRELTSTWIDSRKSTLSISFFWIAMCRKLRPLLSYYKIIQKEVLFVIHCIETICYITNSKFIFVVWKLLLYQHFRRICYLYKQGRLIHWLWRQQVTTLVIACETTYYHNPKDHNIDFHLQTNLKSPLYSLLTTSVYKYVWSGWRRSRSY
jgi:hypothetical protein